MSLAMERLGAVSRAYEQAVNAYRQVALDAAVAEAEHRAERAKAVLRFKASESERISNAEAEARAEADDAIAALYLRRLTTAAEADAHRERLRQLREQQANGRTAVASERLADEMHARGMTGAA